MSEPKPRTGIIRVLVVDDSAFVRKVVREMLERSPYIEIAGMARDGEEALELCEELKPDVVTCDLSMPVLDGVGFVRAQMARRPVPILILSASPEDGEQVMEALEAGAVDFVRKPTALASNDLLLVRQELTEKIKAAAQAPRKALQPREAPARKAVSRPRQTRVDLVVIGISTGGPQALRYLLAQFPNDFPVPVAIVLHMPVGYTALFAEKLNELCRAEVHEAEEGAALRPGRVLLGRAGKHFLISRNSAGQMVSHLSDTPEKPHRPSVDVLFQSAAEACRSRVLGVVMTGMGDDGKQGSAWIKAQGGRVITEAEESCVIYGMPREVVEAGLSDEAVPLPLMFEAIMKNL